MQTDETSINRPETPEFRTYPEELSVFIRVSVASYPVVTDL
jgi:hypothetical protein